MARGQLLISRRVRQACVKLAQVTPRQKRVAAAASAHWSAICDGVQLYCKAINSQQPFDSMCSNAIVDQLGVFADHLGKRGRSRGLRGAEARKVSQRKPSASFAHCFCCAEHRARPEGEYGGHQSTMAKATQASLRRTPWSSMEHGQEMGFANKGKHKNGKKRKSCNVPSTHFEGASTFVHGRKGDLCAFYSGGALNKRSYGKGTPS